MISSVWIFVNALVLKLGPGWESPGRTWLGAGVVDVGVLAPVRGSVRLRMVTIVVGLVLLVILVA